MSTLNITELELQELKNKSDLGKTAEVWKALGQKGDAYAYLAAAIISDDTASMHPIARMFYEMVRSQWNNTQGSDVWGSAVFKSVGKVHLGNYLNLLSQKDSSGAYVLPNTEQIEASYRSALVQHGLDPKTAIDSLFSVLDYAAGNANGNLISISGGMDFSWAKFMDIANLAMGGPRWQDDRIRFNSTVFKSDMDPLDAAITLGRTTVNTMEQFGAGYLLQISPFAPAYWAFKLVDGSLDFTVKDFAQRQAAQMLFQRLDAHLTTSSVDALLSATGNNSRNASCEIIDKLAKTLGLSLPACASSNAQIYP